LTDLFPAGASWKKIEAPSLYALERDLWQALAGSSVAWTCELAATNPLAFWRRLIVISQAPRSQFDALHEELQRGLLLDGPTAVLALDGHEFHGQRGRPWSTVVGNLFLTVGLPVGTPADSYIPGLIMLPAVSLVDAIQLCAGTAAKPTIKWINDILIDGRKVAGVLTATVCRNGTLEAAVLGLGVNVTHIPTIEPTAFVPGAGSLNGAGISVTLGGFVWRVLGTIATRYRTLVEEGPQELLRSYRRASCVVGRRVRVWDESTDGLAIRQAHSVPLADGVVRAINADLSLEIDGREEPVSGGRLALDEACRTLSI
jgi:biotin-[acetyl-CoA-carboxylase] ligase BirA-like protein